MLAQFNASFLTAHPDLLPLVTECLLYNPVQFWLDCSTMPQVIGAVQHGGQVLLYLLFKLTRNYCHTLHKERVRMLEQDQ